MRITRQDELPPAGLTAPERNGLECIARGPDYLEIAAALGRSRKTANGRCRTLATSRRLAGSPRAYLEGTKSAGPSKTTSASNGPSPALTSEWVWPPGCTTYEPGP